MVAPDPSPPRPGASASGSRDAARLTVASLVSGLAAYGFIVVGTNAFGASRFAPISVLWTLWATASAMLVFPVQHWIVRSVTVTGDEGHVAAAMPRLMVTNGGLAAFTLAGSWIGRDTLFRDGSLVYPAAATAIVVGAAVLGVVRGLLAARGRYIALGGTIAGENAIRLLLIMALVFVGSAIEWVAFALVAGFGVMLMVPTALRPVGQPRSVDTGRLMRELATIASGSLGAQLVLTGPPLALAVIGGSPADVTSLFAVMALLRSPYVLALGAIARLTGPLTVLVAARRWRTLDRLRLALCSTALLLAVVAVVAVPIVRAAVRLLFGPTIHLPTTDLALASVGGAMALVALPAMVLLIAAGRAGAVGSSWWLGSAAGVATIVVLASNPVRAVTTGFVVAEVVALVALLFRRPGPTGRSGAQSGVDDQPPSRRPN